MHISEDHFIVECLNPDTLEPVPEGTPGELVFTTLTKRAMPVIRYRTRDIATLDRGPCAAAAPAPAWAASSAAPTTCSSSAASTSFPRRWRKPCSA